MNLKRILSLFGAATVLGFAAAVGVALPGTAANSSSPRPVYQAPQSYYLALGDSMAYGFQPTKCRALDRRRSPRVT